MIAILVLLLVLAQASMADTTLTVPKELKPPVEEGIWIRPASEGDAEPVIGFKNGIRIALWPINGPRGLIRIHTPYVFPDGSHPLLNFVAIEPIVNGWRSYSELENSALDNCQGKRMWFSDDIQTSPAPSLPWKPTRGKTGKIKVGDKTVETLSIVVNIEKLDNGSQPCVQVTFRSDRPNEIGFKVFAAKDSAKMESCVLTATMGNYSRTRLLWLKDEVLDSRKIWPDYKGHDFVWTDDISGDRLRREKDGTCIAAITPNEKNLKDVQMPPGGWHFPGLVSTQYWKKYPGTMKQGLRARVNGRATYYGGSVPIPGGVAFENFELVERYEPGLELWFGVTLKTPQALGWTLNKPAD